MHIFENLFLSIGAAKSGTTWLYELLRQHPDLDLLPIKELHYFWDLHGNIRLLGREQRISNALAEVPRLLPQAIPEEAAALLDWFRRFLSEPVDGNLRPLTRKQRITAALAELPHRLPQILPGEVSTLLTWFDRYLSDPLDDVWLSDLFASDGRKRYCVEFSNMNAVLEPEGWSHIRAVARNVRVLYTLRNPLERLWSHARFHANITGQFDELGLWDREQHAQFLKQTGILAHSSYSRVIRFLRENFSDGEYLVCFVDDMKNRPLALLRQIESFLGISEYEYSEGELSYPHNVSRPMLIPGAFLEAAQGLINNELEALSQLGVKTPHDWRGSIAGVVASRLAIPSGGLVNDPVEVPLPEDQCPPTLIGEQGMKLTINVPHDVLNKAVQLAARNGRSVEADILHYLEASTQDLAFVALPFNATTHAMFMRRHGGRDQIATAAMSSWTAFERPMPQYLYSCAAQWPGVVVDVGANSGFYAILAATANPGNEVLAFEPDPPLYEALRQNINVNTLRHRIAAFPMALSSRAGMASLFVPSQAHGLLDTSSSLEETFIISHSEVHQVNVDTIDHFLSAPAYEQTPVSIIKIDVEGHEAAVLAGAHDTVARWKPILFVEVLDRADFGTLSNFVAQHGYVDVPLRSNNVLATQGTVSFDPSAWNHVFVPAERLEALLQLSRTFNVLG